MHGVLLVSDEPWSIHLLKADLESHGYEVWETGIEGLSLADTTPPELVLLDLNEPNLDGAQIVKELRSRLNSPLVVLSCRRPENNVIELLNAGADDYLTKPFGVNELLARMKVALRGRSAEMAPSVFSCGELTLDFDLRQTFVRGSLIHLTPLEYAIVSILARNHGKIVHQTHLLQELCDERSNGIHPARGSLSPSLVLDTDWSVIENDPSDEEWRREQQSKLFLRKDHFTESWATPPSFSWPRISCSCGGCRLPEDKHADTPQVPCGEDDSALHDWRADSLGRGEAPRLDSEVLGGV